MLEVSHNVIKKFKKQIKEINLDIQRTISDFYFLDIFTKKTDLHVYGEYAKRRYTH